MAFDRIVYVTVKKTNCNRCFLIDLARRQTDHLGPLGIKAKRGQTNARFLKRGYIRLRFPTRMLRQRFAERVRELDHPAIVVTFFRRRRR